MRCLLITSIRLFFFYKNIHASLFLKVQRLDFFFKEAQLTEMLGELP